MTMIVGSALQGGGWFLFKGKILGEDSSEKR